MFQQSTVSRRQCRRSEPKYLPEWKIPRHDRENDAHRLIRNARLSFRCWRAFIRKKSRPVIGVVAACSSTFRDLCNCCRDRLSHFDCHQAGKLVILAVENVRSVAEPFSSLLEGCSPVLLPRTRAQGELLVYLTS